MDLPKIIISVVAVILTIVGYIPYIRDIINKKTKPHAFTWFIFTLAGAIAYALQVYGGAGVGSWPLLTAVIICFVIFLLSLRIGKKDITISDIIFLLLSLLALFMWLVVKQPIWSAILATLVEILGFAPTIRKSWNNPYSETLSTYWLSAIRFGISIFALEKLNILTIMYPLAWMTANIIFTIILITRRKQVGKKNKN
ncbi:hypothetical protein H7X65_02290 [Candidatus Parcubacteria bacterium]|nr:hypothetical protein [Candidatus Parcubacteria bacterium]